MDVASLLMALASVSIRFPGVGLELVYVRVCYSHGHRPSCDSPYPLVCQRLGVRFVAPGGRAAIGETHGSGSVWHSTSRVSLGIGTATFDMGKLPLSNNEIEIGAIFNNQARTAGSTVARLTTNQEVPETWVDRRNSHYPYSRESPLIFLAFSAPDAKSRKVETAVLPRLSLLDPR
ncbi:hypothetical protein B0T25DRAFT_63117 [Lasiosphaeria hispida]|uniref:Uncharacterized protein n=1 Tax=Lasiosphaeria hispida TaxID=260671 RepID=A0AAJ0HWW7_9PEZI|nr:hypothetical protein B0T25DRAFT_63117 [Lasiosphaeria hispida]